VHSSTEALLSLIMRRLYELLGSSKLNFSHRFGMVYYNNLLSAALIFPFCIMRGEFKAFLDPTVMTPQFIFWNCVAGFLGFFLNFASLWCVSSTSATTYAVIGKQLLKYFSASRFTVFKPSLITLLHIYCISTGSLNKIPITFLGFVVFHAKMTEQGITYISLASLGGLIYGYAKIIKRPSS
jgi:GDP-mannose transporter